MGKKLAIKGHPTRGEEVIELLEMLGGKNIHNYGGTFNECYAIDNNKICTIYTSVAKIDGYEIFTLEEFLVKYPFKVGDKVPNFWGNSLTIKSMSWDENHKTVMYGFEDSLLVVRGEDLKPVNDNTKPTKMKNVLTELLEHIKTTPKEDLEREFEEIESDGWFQIGPSVEEFIDFCNKINKKPKYPDNYEDCVRIAKNIHGYDIHIDTPAYSELMESFVKLLICRDAYWKIAGEQMGLDKPWEPDWNDLNRKYFISLTCDGIGLYDDFRNPQVLVFPTAEMRDAFYENFKDLIEQCKSLL